MTYLPSSSCLILSKCGVEMSTLAASESAQVDRSDQGCYCLLCTDHESKDYNQLLQKEAGGQKQV